MGVLYDDAAFLAAFADSLAGEGQPVVAIAGCGTAATVAKLREYGVEACGFDASRRVLESVPEPTREWVLEADLRDEDLVETLRETFGIDRIDVFVTECVLSFLTVEEARAALARIRGDRVGKLAHRVRIDPPVAAQEGKLDATVLSPSEWRAACDPEGADVWRDATEPWGLAPAGDRSDDGLEDGADE